RERCGARASPKEPEAGRRGPASRDPRRGRGRGGRGGSVACACALMYGPGRGMFERAASRIAAAFFGRSAMSRLGVLAALLSPLLLLVLVAADAPASGPAYDVIVRGGTIYDGSGGKPLTGDVAIQGDRIAAVGDLKGAQGKTEIDARGLAVAPGFVNMLSWATDTLLVDGRAQSDVRQGVTLEVFGEGWSMGPLNETMRKEALEQQGDLKYDIPWTTLGEYHEHGYANRPPNPDEIARMCALVKQAMDEGALGLGSSLIYAPAFYAETDELAALAAVAGNSGGRYISHMRSEGNRLLEAVDELTEIARRGNLPAEIYHLKAAGRPNWPKLDALIAKVEAARKAGLDVSADMYTYTAGATGLDAAMPPWV